MFIQTEDTPNPDAMKFIPGQEVMEKGTASFSEKEAAKVSPLANALFSIENIEGVFFGKDFISVTKNKETDWGILKPSVLTTIMEHFISGAPLFDEEPAPKKKAKKSANTEDDSEIVKQIKELIETRVRPAVAEDGGDIVFHSFEEGIVKLEMHGACAGCPSSTATLKVGIENMLRHYVPEVESVEAINDEIGDL